MEDLLVQVSRQVDTNLNYCTEWCGSRVTTAPNQGKMIVQKLPYILYRAYPSYGYLSDNRNFGYDTAAHSCIKVGDLLLSKTGSVFYQGLKDTPQNVDDIVYKLSKFYPNVAFDTIKEDALDFYRDLFSKGFIFCGEEKNYQAAIQQYFSYGNMLPFKLRISQSQNSQTIEENFGNGYNLTSVHIDISSRCNENCIHCYIPSSYKCSIMSENLFTDILEQCSSLNVLNLTISGGEPMLNPYLKDFLLRCKQKNFSVNLLTNLTLLSNELLDVISSTPLISVQTSLYAMDASIHDSITRNKGSFWKTVDGIRRLHERNVPLQINCPIMKQNKMYFGDVLRFAKSLNIEADADYILYGCFDHSNSNLSCRLSTEEIKDVVTEKYLSSSNGKIMTNKNNDADDPICPVCKHSLCISNTGNIYPCEGWQNFKLGNLKENTLREIWEKGSLVLYLRSLKYKDFPKCNLCLNKKYCSICLIMNANEESDGDYKNTNTFMCKVAKIKHEIINKR